MYAWKCWRDTRSFFIVFLIIAATSIPVIAAVAVQAELTAEFGTSVVLPTFYLILAAVALGLGAIGAIQEFSDKTIQFLFTKPRRRSYFIWIGWLVGCTEMLSIALANLLSAWATSAYCGRPFFHLVTIEDIIGIFIYNVIVYALSYSTTAILRGGLKGLGASLGIISGLQAIAIAFRVRWQINIPIPPLRIGTLPIAVSDLVWASVALILVFVAQRAVERAEV